MRPGGKQEGASLERCLGQARTPDGQRGEEGDPSIADPVALFRHLESTDRFRRDRGFGGIFHAGRLSLRENRATDSLHVVIGHNHISAHIDQVSPLHPGPAPRIRYSLRRMAAHNVVGMAEVAIRLARGRQGDHRSHLDCEWLWDPAEAVAQADDLLDREASAWSVQLEAQVGGTLEAERLRGALNGVLARFPLDHDPLTVVDCPDQMTLDRARAEFQSQPAGMTEWPPLRARLARTPDGDVFMLNVNHAASDGFDAMRLLRTIATTYRTGVGPESPPDFPAVHGLPVRPTSAPVSAVRARWRRLSERGRDFLAPPAQTAPDEPTPDPAFGFHLICLPDGQARQLVDPARPGASRNTLLAALHRTIGQWNHEHHAPAHRINVLVSVDLRTPDWPLDRVGNFSVTARVSTSHRHRRQAAATLKAVTSQTTRNKRARTGTALLAALERSGLLGLWSKQSLVVLQPLTRNRRVDAALLSNLGWVEEAPSFGAGAGLTRHLWYSSPARAPLTLCVGAVTVCGRLHLVVRYPRRLFSPDAARRFADRFVAETVAVTAEGQ